MHDRIKSIWAAIQGRLSYQRHEDMITDLYKAEYMASRAKQLERELSWAKAAIAELKSQLSMDYEAQRKAASDALGNAAIADMRANPEKYIK
jgi:hypothetical protein